MLAAVERVGASHYGLDRQETGEQKAQRIVLEAMKRLAELPEAGTADR